jgi:hypothetical protein
MMNEHICFNIQELHTHNLDKLQQQDNFNEHDFHNFADFDNLLIDMNRTPYDDYVEYMTNYNVKTLTNILGYYNINKNKLVKDEMVQLIIFFENEPANKTIVYQRKRLWKNILELKNNEYFKKFILF